MLFLLLKPINARNAAAAFAEPKAEVKAPEAKPSAAAAEVKADAKAAEAKPAKHAKHVAKTEAKASQKTPVARAVLTVPAEARTHTAAIENDLKAVGRIEELTWEDGAEFGVSEIELAPVD